MSLIFSSRDPRWGDAEFYGKWLLAAAKAEALWKEAMTTRVSRSRLIG